MILNEQIIEFNKEGFVEKRSPYKIRLAKTPQELDAIFSLRYKVFFEELGASSLAANTGKLDFDEYDEYCDHLFVSYCDKIIATYRILPLERLRSTNLSSMYSASEFNLEPWLKQQKMQGVFELGRACVASEYRSRNAFALLWKGLSQYLLQREVKTFCGCTSVYAPSMQSALAFKQHIQKQGLWHHNLDLEPQEKYKIICEEQENIHAEVPLIPPLLQLYFNVGAVLCGGPAYDKDFGCFDFFTVCNTDFMLQKSFNKRAQIIL